MAEEKREIRLVVSSSPHMHSGQSVPRMMYLVAVALVPAIVSSVYFFKMGAVVVIVPAVAACLITEAIACRMRGRPVAIADGSALITGILLAMTLPPFTPWYVTVVGGVFAIAIAKHVFGGLGNNIFNPALAGRAFLTASYPVAMTSWTSPEVIKSWAVRAGEAVDGVTSATPLALAKFEGADKIGELWTAVEPMFVGNTGGCIGETSALLLAAGGIILLAARVIDWRIPVTFVGTVFIATGALFLADAEKYASPVYHILAGGLLLGAFFMATDLVTSPVTRVGRLVFGVGCGLLTVLIRIWGGFPEGVMFAILIMNSITPLINRWTKPIPFGGRPKNG